MSSSSFHSRAALGRLDHLLAKYGGRVPRYTSYPTAVQFSPEVDTGHYARELAALGRADGPVSLYLHIPFCAKLCWYCGCHTKIVNSAAPVEDYVEDLLAEIDLVAAGLSERLAVASIHFGGGTPNMLSPDAFRRILDRLRAKFDVADDADIAVEIDPRLLTRDFADAAAQSGVTRASLGVQDFRREVQAAINRAQPYSLVAAASDTLRAAGIGGINLDLMYGLPKQTQHSLATSVAEALTLAPDRLSLFNYAHVPWLKAHQKLIVDKDLPDARARLLMQRQATHLLEGADFVRLGLDHFARATDPLARAAKDKTLRRNFQGYTDDQAGVLIGFGASAISRLPRAYVQNAAEVGPWRGALEKGELPVVRGVTLTAEDQFRAEIIERLMCDFAVDLKKVTARHGRSLAALDAELAELADMAADGLLDFSDGGVEVSEDGRDFVRSICAVFDHHLSRDGLRHAQAV